mgnify:CR=1 FL=1
MDAGKGGRESGARTSSASTRPAWQAYRVGSNAVAKVFSTIRALNARDLVADVQPGTHVRRASLNRTKGSPWPPTQRAGEPHGHRAEWPRVGQDDVLRLRYADHFIGGCSHFAGDAK